MNRDLYLREGGCPHCWPSEPMARPLRSSDRPQPIDSWQRDLTLVLFAIAALLLIAAAALLLNPPVGPA